MKHVSEDPVIEPRRERLFAFLRYNRDQLIVDATVLLTWMLVSSAVFRFFVLPPWLHYVVLFVGIYLYARVSPDWERPYVSPDISDR